MNVFMPRSDIGRHVFGLAGLAFGIITLVWHNYKDWDELRPFLNATDGPVFTYAAACAWIFGGVAMQFRRTASVAALVLGEVYFVFALSYVPPIVAAPLVYDRWGNLFEQLALLTGALLIYRRVSPVWPPEILQRMGRLLFGVCVASFTVEQAIHLSDTASLVPKWLPPNQMFWALATTVAFALAAVALLTSWMALLATRLLTLMLVLFGIVVWLPILAVHHHSHFNWSETAETFAIAGTAWVLAEILGESRTRDHR
jgi:hypothetical protein